MSSNETNAPGRGTILDGRIPLVSHEHLWAPLRHTEGAGFEGAGLAGLGDADEDRIALLLHRYRTLLRDAAPELTRGEWCAICDALNGTLLDATGVDLLWAEVAEAERWDRLGEKWEIDVQALVARLRELPTAGKYAVREVVESFWRQEGRGIDEALHLAGARIAQSGGA